MNKIIVTKNGWSINYYTYTAQCNGEILSEILGKTDFQLTTSSFLPDEAYKNGQIVIDVWLQNE